MGWYFWVILGVTAYAGLMLGVGHFVDRNDKRHAEVMRDLERKRWVKAHRGKVHRSGRGKG